MRPASTSALRFGALLCILASVALALAPNPVHVSGNRALVADASAFVSNGIASQLPPQDRRLVTSDDRDSAPRLVEKLSPSTFSVSPIEAASFNVKAVAHVGINILLDLASSNSLVGYLIGNETTTFPKSDSTDDVVKDGSAASGRRQITGMSVALVIVMIFFAVWM
ncbi:hypothetical protein EDB80DRAFT_123743 [Ilyonectria destructans]|nr:hypothetical protein EDB80DRAFT_123743 [Ilyonectria destructans]